MVKLRFSRFGKKGQATFRLIAIQARDKRQGEAIEYLGFYNPRSKPSTFEYDKERVKYWLGVGAQPTGTVRYYLAKDKLVKPVKHTYQDKPGRKRQAIIDAAAVAREKATAEKEAAKEAAKAEKEAAKAAKAEAKAETVAVESTQAAS